MEHINIALARRLAGYERSGEFATANGMSRTLWSAYETGIKAIPGNRIPALAAALKLSEDECLAAYRQTRREYLLRELSIIEK